MPIIRDSTSSNSDITAGDFKKEHQKVAKLPSQGYPSAPPDPVITRQPSTEVLVPPPSQGWTNILLPSSNGDFPAALDYLSGLDQVRIRQFEEEDCTKLQIKRQYQIKNNMGDILFYAVEDSDYSCRVCCGPLHSFTTTIVDTFGNGIIKVHRPIACKYCCFFFYPQKIEIFMLPRTLIGVIEEEDCCSANFAVKNQNGETILIIAGPCCRSWFGAVNFQIMASHSAVPIGKITREWSNCFREYTSDANNFRVTFPRDLDVKTKVMLMSVCFLLDYMFFEYKPIRVCLNRRSICLFLTLIFFGILFGVFCLFV